MKNLYIWLASMVMIMVSGLAAAALPTEIGTTLSALQADGTAIFALIIPIVGIFVGFSILLKLFKRFTRQL